MPYPELSDARAIRSTDIDLIQRYPVGVVGVTGTTYGGDRRTTDSIVDRPLRYPDPTCPTCRQTWATHRLPETYRMQALSHDPSRWNLTFWRPPAKDDVKRSDGTRDDCVRLHLALEVAGFYATWRQDLYERQRREAEDAQNLPNFLNMLRNPNSAPTGRLPNIGIAQIIGGYLEPTNPMRAFDEASRDQRDKAKEKRVKAGKARINTGAEGANNDTGFVTSSRVMIGVLHILESDRVYAAYSGAQARPIFNRIATELNFVPCPTQLPATLLNRALNPCPQDVQALRNNLTCAAPRLIQTALDRGHTPIAMTEVWFNPANTHGVYANKHTIRSCVAFCRDTVPLMLCTR